jgi:predicted transcriptional regulator
MGRRKEQQDSRVFAAIKKKRLEERKKKSLFANIADLKRLTKQEYHEFREQKFYLMPRDTTSAYFYRIEHERIYEQVYACMSTKVYPMKFTNIVSLSKDEYFADALWVMEKMGLHKLMVFKQDYSHRLIQQFYATLEFDTRDEVGFTWMSDEVRKNSTITRFG